MTGTGRVTERLRAVLDTNVFVSAFLSRNPTSPTREIVRRWQAGEFVLLSSRSLLDEVTEKLLAAEIQRERIWRDKDNESIAVPLGASRVH